MRINLSAALVLTYSVSLVLGWTEDLLRTAGSNWANLPGLSFLVMYCFFIALSRRRLAYFVLSLPALVYAERQFFTIVLMVVPYLFSDKL